MVPCLTLGGQQPRDEERLLHQPDKGNQAGEDSAGARGPGQAESSIQEHAGSSLARQLARRSPAGISASEKANKASGVLGSDLGACTRVIRAACS